MRNLNDPLADSTPHLVWQSLESGWESACGCLTIESADAPLQLTSGPRTDGSSPNLSFKCPWCTVSHPSTKRL